MKFQSMNKNSPLIITRFNTLLAVLLLLPLATLISQEEVENYMIMDEDGSLEIKSSAHLTLFLGSPADGRWMGIVTPKKSQKFNISKIPHIPQQGIFFINAVNTIQYLSNGMSATEKDVIYTGVVFYDLDNTNQKIKLTIPEQIDENRETFIYVSNMSDFILELRLNSPDGPVVSVLPPLRINKQIWIKSDENDLPLHFLPVYHYQDNDTEDIISIKESSGPRFEPIQSGVSIRVLDFYGPTGYANISKGQLNILFK